MLHVIFHMHFTENNAKKRRKLYCFCTIYSQPQQSQTTGRFTIVKEKLIKCCFSRSLLPNIADRLLKLWSVWVQLKGSVVTIYCIPFVSQVEEQVSLHVWQVLVLLPCLLLTSPPRRQILIVADSTQKHTVHCRHFCILPTSQTQPWISLPFNVTNTKLSEVKGRLWMVFKDSET